MPSISNIDLTNGILIDSSDRGTISISELEFAVLPSITPGDLESKLTAMLQSQFEETLALSTRTDPEDRLLQDPPVLLANERIEKITGKPHLVTTTMWVAIHVYSTDPLNYNIKCQNANLGPITEEWW